MHPNLQTIHALYEAFGRGDLPAVLALLSDDVHWQVMGSERHLPLFGQRQGKPQVSDFFLRLNQLTTDMSFIPQTFHALDNDQVVTSGIDSASSRHTGRQYHTEWVHWFTLRDGKITRFKEFYDTGSIAEAMGTLTRSTPA